MDEKLEAWELTPAQMEILEIVWDRGSATVGELHETLASRRPVARNTVLTMMNRLVAKGRLSRRPEGSLFRYYATATRKRTLRTLAARFVDGIFGGRADELVLTLLQSGISAEEADRIRARLKEAAGRPEESTSVRPRRSRSRE